MKKTITLSFVFFASCFSTGLIYAINITEPIARSGCLGDQNIGWEENYDGVILKEIESRNNHIINKDNLVEKKAIFPDCSSASKASRILFLNTIDNKSYVVKEVRSYENENPTEFNREEILISKNNLKSWNNIINEYELNNKLKLPKLVEYIDTFCLNINSQKNCYTLMTKAEGESLINIKKEFSNVNTKITDIEAEKIGKNIGIQMGNLAKAFFEKNGTFLKHADPGRQNFFYDKIKEQFYWIDLGGTEETSYLNPKINESYRSSEVYVIKPIWWALFPFNEKHKLREINEKIIEDINNINLLKPQRLAIIAGNTFFNNYKDIIKKLQPELDKINGVNLDQYNDNIIESLNEFNNEYKKQLDEIFGVNSEKVKKYLFNPISNNNETNSSKYLEQELNNLVTNYSNNIVNKLKHDARYNLIDPIRNELNRLDYDSYRLDDPRGENHKLKILKSDIAKKSINSVIKNIVNNYNNEIQYDLNKVNYNGKALEEIKELITLEVFNIIMKNLEYNASLTAYRN